MPPGRPIANVDTDSSHISQYIDQFIHPVAGLHPASINDTFHVISYIRIIQVTEECLLVTADVTSLYTNIYIDTAISKHRSQFNLHPDLARPDYVIVELIK